MAKEAATTSTAAAISSLGDGREALDAPPASSLAWHPHRMFPRVTLTSSQEVMCWGRVLGWRGLLRSWWHSDSASAVGPAAPHPVSPGPWTLVPCRGLQSWALPGPPGVSCPPPSGFVRQPRAAPSCRCWVRPAPGPAAPADCVPSASTVSGSRLLPGPADPHCRPAGLHASSCCSRLRTMPPEQLFKTEAKPPDDAPLSLLKAPILSSFLEAGTFTKGQRIHSFSR